MELGTASALCALNNEFYRKRAKSFSATREAPWRGWRRVLSSIPAPCDGAGYDSPGVRRGDGRLRVLDVACGNLRFERFLAAECPAPFSAFAVDSCDEMALAALADRDFGEGSVDFLHADVVGRLLENDGGDDCFGLSSREEERAAFDAVVSFGFMHHVPGKENRLRLLRAFVDATRPGGVVAVSLWRFMDDERLARKARTITDGVRNAGFAEAVLPSFGLSDFERGDYLLGWKDDSSALRYCHHFDEIEISSLVSCVSSAAMLLDRFSADGKSGRLNEYLVFRRL